MGNLGVQGQHSQKANSDHLTENHIMETHGKHTKPASPGKLENLGGMVHSTSGILRHIVMLKAFRVRLETKIRCMLDWFEMHL